MPEFSQNGDLQRIGIVVIISFLATDQLEAAVVPA